MSEKDAELIVLEGIDCCRHAACKQCPYRGTDDFGTDDCGTKMMDDVIAVLKRYIKRED